MRQWNTDSKMLSYRKMENREQLFGKKPNQKGVQDYLKSSREEIEKIKKKYDVNSRGYQNDDLQLLEESSQDVQEKPVFQENPRDERPRSEESMDGYPSFLNQRSQIFGEKIQNQNLLIYMGAFVVVVLFVLNSVFQTNCLSEYKKYNCSSLENFKSENCQYYRTCLAKDSEGVALDIFLGIIVAIVSGFTYYLRELKVKFE